MAYGSDSDLGRPARHVRSTPDSDQVADIAGGPVRATTGLMQRCIKLDTCAVSRELLGNRILVNRSILHDDDKILSWILDQLNIRSRVTVNKQQVRKRAFLNDAQLSFVGAT